ncbi:hypothetical protein GQ42DRAFT_117894, partial [Ramicandelaber brevisporus]
MNRADQTVLDVLVDPDPSWNEFGARIKTLVVDSFDRHVQLLEDDIRRLDACRMLPGWNYCTFFVMKESLALLLDQVGFSDDALRQYDELEASFYQAVHDGAVPWFRGRGGGSTGDDNVSILDLHPPRGKPYRDLIRNNDITVFDFCMYLFGCQSTLLLRAGQAYDFVERSRRFVQSLLSTLRMFSANPDHAVAEESFVAAWTFGFSLSVTQIIDTLEQVSPDSSTAGDDTEGNESRAATPVPAVDVDAELALAKADFFALARKQLDILGPIYSRVPIVTSNIHQQHQAPTPPQLYTVSYPMLRDALSNDTAYDNVYIYVSNVAITYYERLGRIRHCQTLRSDIATL